MVLNNNYNMSNRKVILSILCIFIFINVHAQWGIVGGLNTSNSSGSDAEQQAIGYQIGLFRDIHLQDRFYIRPQLILSNERLSKRVSGEKILSRYNITEANQLSIHEDAFYATLPVTLSYRIPLKENQKIAFDLGGYMACGLFGDSYYEIWESTTYWKSTNEATFPYRKRFDAGCTLSVSYEFNSFVYSIQSKYGFINIDPIEDSGKLMTYYFNIGYKF